MGVVPCDYLVSTQLLFWLVCCWAVTITPKCIETNLTFDNFSLFNNKCLLQAKYRLFFSKDTPSTDHLFWKYRPNSPNFLNSMWGIMASLIKHILIPLNTVNYMVENRIPYSQPNLSSCLLYLALSLYPPPSYRIVSFILIHKKGLLNYENSSWWM